MVDSSSVVSEPLHRQNSQETAGRSLLRVTNTQIGDLLMISKLRLSVNSQLVPDTLNLAPSQFQRSEGEELHEFLLTAEGLLDPCLYAAPVSGAQHLAECSLFELQLPRKAAAKAGKKAQKVISERSRGAVVAFGQLLELKHVQSGYTVSIDTRKAASCAGACKALVVPMDLATSIRLLPVSATSKLGQSIQYSEKVNIALEADRTKYYLATHSRRGDEGLEVHAGLSKSEWSFVRYEPCEGDKNEFLRTNVPVDIRNV